MTSRKSFTKGMVIFEEGQLELCLYEIAAGTVGIYAHYGQEDEQLLTELGPGRVFGEMGLIDASPRSATAVALTTVQTNVVDADGLTDYFRNDPQKIVDMFANLTDRLRSLSDSYVEVCRTICDYVEAEKKEERPQSLLDKIRQILEEANTYEKELAMSTNYIIMDTHY